MTEIKTIRIPERVQLIKYGVNPYANLYEDSRLRIIEQFKCEYCENCTLSGSRCRLIINGFYFDYNLMRRHFKINLPLEPFANQSEVKLFCKNTLCYAFYNENNEICGIYCPRRQKIYAPSIENIYVLIKYIGDFGCKITVGSDIELALCHYSDDMPIRARRTKFNSLQSQIGCDGSGEQLELRITPGSSPKEVVNNIYKLLYSLRNYRYIIRAQSNMMPLGAHIHINIENEFGDPLIDSEIMYHLALLLDYFLGVHFARQPAYRIRQLWGYGNPYYLDGRAVRTTHAHNGFEYRTPSAFLVHEPKFSEIAFEIIFRIINYYLNNPGKVIKLPISDGATIKDYVEILKLAPEKAVYFKNKFMCEPPKDDIRITWGVISSARRINNLRRRMQLARKFFIPGRMTVDVFDKFLKFAETIPVAFALKDNAIELVQQLPVWDDSNFYFHIKKEWFNFEPRSNLCFVVESSSIKRPVIELPNKINKDILASVKNDFEQFFQLIIENYDKLKR